MLDRNIEDLLRYATRHQLVGSRITCNPPPVDTDQDVLVLISEENADYFVSKMKNAGFDVELGEGYAEDALNSGEEDRFQSYRLGDVNLIVTVDEKFYARFAAATDMAKRANLLDKEERIALFQAVLYGNSGAESVPPPEASAPTSEPSTLPTPKDYIRPWWVTAEGAGSGCVEALNEAEATAIGSEKLGARVTECQQLPYPASPRLHIEPGHYGVCPSFCYQPSRCKGRSCCPQNISCVE